MSETRTLPRFTKPEELRSLALDTGYAVIGVTDLAVNRVLKASTEMREAIEALPEQARKLPATAKAFSEDTRAEVEQNFDDLAGRGKKLVDRLTGGKRPDVIATEVITDAVHKTTKKVDEAADEAAEATTEAVTKAKSAAAKAADDLDKAADDAAAKVADSKPATSKPAAKKGTATKKAAATPRRRAPRSNSSASNSTASSSKSNA